MPQKKKVTSSTFKIIPTEVITTQLEEHIRKIVREELQHTIEMDTDHALESLIRKVVRKIKAEKSVGSIIRAQEQRDRMHLLHLRKTLARIEELLKMYVNTRFVNVSRPTVIFPDGTSLGFGFAAHLTKDPGGFKLLEFGGYEDFYRLPLEKRNYFLIEALRRFHIIVPSNAIEDQITDTQVFREPSDEELENLNINDLPAIQDQYDRVIAMLKRLQAQIRDPKFIIPS